MTKRFYSFLKLTGIYSVCTGVCLKIGSLGFTVPIDLLANSHRKATVVGFTLSMVYQQASQASKNVTGWHRLPPGYLDSTVERDTASLLCQATHCFPTFLESLCLPWLTCHFPRTHMNEMTPHNRQFHKKLHIER